jgi:WD40 repeat protein
VLCDLKSATRYEVPFRGCWDSSSIHTGAWSPDGKFFAVASTGGWPCVLDTATWKPVVRWRVPEDTQYWSGGALGFLAFSSEGTLLSRYADGTLRGLKLPLAPESITLLEFDSD